MGSGIKDRCKKKKKRKVTALCHYLQYAYAYISKVEFIFLSGIM